MKSQTIITDNLARLRWEFPLEARIKAADADTHDAYATVLTEWLKNGIAPQPDIMTMYSLKKLVSPDAVVITKPGLGCYPFSAADTGIKRLCSGYDKET